jgi:hypothetical protein
MGNKQKMAALMARIEAERIEDERVSGLVATGAYEIVSFDQVAWKYVVQLIPGHEFPRCGATCRDGHLCQFQAVPGALKCKQHGGRPPESRTKPVRKANTARRHRGPSVARQVAMLRSVHERTADAELRAKISKKIDELLFEAPA